MKQRSIIIIFAVFILIAGFAFYPTPGNQAIRYVDRQSGEIRTEKVAREKWLIWLYNNPIGELTLHALVKRKFLSSFYGYLMDRPASAEKIEPFVEAYDIELDIAQKQQFRTFNDFFIRKLKKGAREIDMDTMTVVSPADGKILAYEDVSGQDFIVKGYRFDLSSFLDNTRLEDKYRDGSLMIFRLCPVDYHRFHFPVDGKISQPVRIEGDYYSVSPIALRKMAEIFCRNKREYVIISTKYFGDVIMAEVGATMVGSIVQTYPGNTAWKGAEKGFFKFGGSSVVLIFEKNKILIDKDLLQNTKNNLETSLLMGERIATGIHVYPDSSATAEEPCRSEEKVLSGF